MAARPFNFSPGPSIVPPEVLEGAMSALAGVPEMKGLSVVEVSHRLPFFEGVVAETEALLRELLAIPEDYAVLFLQGGARQQFAQIPMSFLGQGQKAGYVDTGVWARGAWEEAKTLGEASLLYEGSHDGYRSLPDLGALEVPAGLSYVHTTSNNTIYGTQFHDAEAWAKLGQQAPHICDMSSDILSRPLNVSDFAMIYAGAQKNAGIPGVTMIILKREFMEKGRQDIPSIWQYRVQAKNDSMFNTPPTFAIYVTLLTLRYLKARGGLDQVQADNEAKAAKLYAAVDGSNGFYQPFADKAARSLMNVTFRMADEATDKRFVAEAEGQGLHHLKAHRKTGGIRASLYNAMPMAGVDALVAFMAEFAAKNG